MHRAFTMIDLRHIFGTTKTAAFLAAAVLTLMSYDVEAQSPWEADMQAFDDADRANPPPSGAVLFIGSSSIRMWTTLADDFEGVQVVNRGFGGSHMIDVIHHAHQIVVPYAPRLIVLYEGDNDIASGKSARRVFDDYRRFVSIVRNRLPDTRIAFIAIKPSLARWDMAPQMRAANEMIREYAGSREHLDYIDVWEPMLGGDGRPLSDLFLDDGLHMNEKGYSIWTRVVAPFLTTE